MDEVARYNQERWRQLAEANALFTRPHLDLTPETAQARVDPEGMFGDLAGKDVLCLAGGGGQQSAAFALLNSRVTVFDLSEAQLERDRQAALHYGIEITAIQGDMRDLSALAPDSFDLVFQPYSLGFVPDCRVVFAQVAQVLRPGGLYFFAIGNPFTLGMNERDWNGEGYTLRHPYVDGESVITLDADWVYTRASSEQPPIQQCREYRQTFSKLLNSLIAEGFHLLHFSDSRDLYGDVSADPGTWDHLVAYTPPFLTFWLRYLPASRP